MPNRSGKQSARTKKSASESAGEFADRFTVDRRTLSDLLRLLGWVRVADPSEDQLRSAVAAYQGFHGLDVDGWAGPQTARSFDALRICNHPDVMPIGEGLGKWPNPNIKWWIDEASLSGLPVAADVVVSAFEWAWSQWVAVCGISAERTMDASNANVVARFGTIDGSAKVLAWGELANNTQTTKQQRYDSQETWVYSESPQRFQIDLGRVACHEIGHVIGIGHIASGNLLQPTYDRNIRSPQRGDIQEAQARYGPSRIKPTDPPPPPAGNFTLTLSGTGVIGSLEATGFRVERIS